MKHLFLWTALLAAHSPVPFGGPGEQEPDAGPTTASRFEEVLGSRMHYLERGAGDPILFLHGNQGLAHGWRDVLPHAARVGRAIAVDLIGMGRSDLPELEYRFRDHARYVEAFIEALELKDVTIVGHDWGAAIGLFYARRHPENVKGLVLMETKLAPYASWDEFPAPLRELFQELRAPELGRRLVVDENLMGDGPRTLRAMDESARDVYRAALADPARRVPLWRFVQELPVAGEPADVDADFRSHVEWLRAARIPKLILTCSPGLVLSPEDEVWCHEELSDLRVVDLGPGLHHPQEEQPEALGRELAAWYADLAARPADGAPELGTWELSGHDDRDWEATLVLEQRLGGSYSGYILWTTTSEPEASGRELVDGWFDPRRGTLSMRGREVVDPEGSVVPSEYVARVADGGRRLVDGVWGGANVIPGVWTASWKGADVKGAEVARTPHFALHSHELFNLHHFLYQCAKTLARRGGERVPGRPVPVTEIAAVDALEGEERDAWLAAVDFYRHDAIARDLLFDGELYALKGTLTSIADPDGEWPAEVDAEYASALRTALPVYRAHFWSAHDAANRAWIAGAAELLERYEAELVERMTSAYGGSWPPPPVRVDVCAYANWAGAYTTGEPAHVTLSSTDPEAQGHAALETLVHEASHTSEMFSGLRVALAAAYEARGAEPPRDLWHLFIFATAGEAVRRTLAEDGIDGYVHYGERAGVYGRGTWAEQLPRFIEPWTAFLDGEIDRATALALIAEAIE